MIVAPKHHKGVMPFFVYGTLMLGEGNDARWHDRVDRVEQGLVVAGYQLKAFDTDSHVATFPYAMVDPDPDHYVMGELLWPASDEDAGWLTASFDGLEGHPDNYVRTEVMVLRNARETVPAWMYVYPDSVLNNHHLVTIGSSWKDYLRRKDQSGAKAWSPGFVGV